MMKGNVLLVVFIPFVCLSVTFFCRKGNFLVLFSCLSYFVKYVTPRKTNSCRNVRELRILLFWYAQEEIFNSRKAING